jgi:D-alanine-D-alanine ligase-like ATP-grasp enzyme
MKYLRIRSRNHSAKALAKQIVCTKNIVCRLGSFTANEDIFTPLMLKKGIVELNTVDACKLSNDKLRMKQAFDEAHVNTSLWLPLKESVLENNRLYETEVKYKQNPIILTFPCIIKHIHSSKGEKIYYIPTEEDYKAFREKYALELEKYIIEHYYNYSKEYRVHVSELGAFYSCRKMLLNDVPIEQRFHRHHVNTVWIVPENEQFETPVHWDLVLEDCVRAIRSIGLSIGCVDVLVTKQNNLEPDWKILETNSAPALGEITTELYIKELTKLCKHYEEQQ